MTFVTRPMLFFLDTELDTGYKVPQKFALKGISMATKIFENGQEAWALLRGRKNKDEQQRLNARFKKAFPRGHNESIRHLCSAPVTPKSLQGIHPRALRLLARYGKDYTPKHWNKLPDFGFEPKLGHCFLNSVLLMYAGIGRQGPLPYIEGIAFGPLADEPMYHAWNSYRGPNCTAADSTFSAGSHWIRYFGIPFPCVVYETIQSILFPGDKTRIEPLLWVQNFEKIESHLEEVLAERKD